MSEDVTPIRAIIAVRVSSEDQKAKGFSHRDQLEGLPALVAAQGWVLASRPNGSPGIYDEGAATTTPIADDELGLVSRPVLRELLDELGHTKPAWLVCRSVDRIHRNNLQFEFLTSRMLRAGMMGFAQFPTTSGAPHLREIGDHRQRAWASMEATFATLEKDEIKERLMNSRRARANSGMPNGGRVPYGYARVPKAPKSPFAVVDEEAETYRQMVAWATDGHGPAWIAKHLNDAGRLTRAGTASWSATTVRRILESQAQVGRIRASFGVGARGAKTRQKDVWLSAGHPALIDHQAWEAMRLVRTTAGASATPSDNRKRHALAGLLTCPTCGRTLKAHVNRPKKPGGGRYEYWHYTCRVYDSGCTKYTSISEKRALRELAGLLAERLDATDESGWLAVDARGDASALEDRLQALNEKHRVAARRLRRTEERYEEVPDRLAVGAAERLRLRGGELLAVEDELLEARRRLLAATRTAAAPRVHLEELALLLRDWSNFVDDDRKRRVLELVIEQAVVHPPRTGQRLEVTWRAA